MIQNLFDGILVGSNLSLGAIGLTMVMHMLRFANFSHAELLSLGAYVTFVFDKLLESMVPALSQTIGGLSLTFSLIFAIILSMGVTGVSAIIIDWLVFRRIRDSAGPLSMVFASFGVALIVRNLISLIFGLKPKLYSEEITFAVRVSLDPLILIKLDQVFVLCMALVIMLIFHFVLSRTTFGYALKAVSENPTLSQINGVRLALMIRLIWLIGGGLAAVAGVFYGLNNQVSFLMGNDLVLSLFAAVIVGGIGSIYGAVVGGFLVGLASNMALLILPSGYKPAVPFLIILIILSIRPTGLFGEKK